VKTLFAVLLAFASSSLYALATSAQALEARRTPPETALRASLLARLVRRPIWLAGTAAGFLAWPVQAVALSLGSVALVQPAMGFGLVVLLLLGVAFLGERVGPREIAGVGLVIGAVGILAWAAPSETGSFTRAGTWIVGIGSWACRAGSRRASPPVSAGPGSGSRRRWSTLRSPTGTGSPRWRGRSASG
jgi:multidrug transporter EmrE-like cation transporter